MKCYSEWCTYFTTEELEEHNETIKQRVLKDLLVEIGKSDMSQEERQHMINLLYKTGLKN